MLRITISDATSASVLQWNQDGMLFSYASAGVAEVVKAQQKTARIAKPIRRVLLSCDPDRCIPSSFSSE
jgi:hypothetical protein